MLLAKDAFWGSVEALGGAVEAAKRAPDAARSVADGGKAAVEGAPLLGDFACLTCGRDRGVGMAIEDGCVLTFLM